MDKDLLASVYDMSRDELMGVVVALIKDKPIREAIDDVRGKKRKRIPRPKTVDLFSHQTK